MDSSRAPLRKVLRLRGYDYSRCGPYFITVCTAGGACILGRVRDGTVALSASGRIVLAEWNRLPEFSPWAWLDAFVIMPNHLHGVLSINIDPESVRAPPGPAPTLPRLMQVLKSRSAISINRLRGTPGAIVWQRGYYEQIIGSDRAYGAILEYIDANPRAWRNDPMFRES